MTSTFSNLLAALKTPSNRLALPAAHADPAFSRCLEEASSSPELIENFDRLFDCRLSRISSGSPIETMIDVATGFQGEQLRRFSEFVHEYVYMRLPDEAIDALRLAERQLEVLNE